MSIYQPNLEVFEVTLLRNDSGEFVEINEITRVNSRGKRVEASKRDKSRLQKQLYDGIKP
jgi:hypothetical protein